MKRTEFITLAMKDLLIPSEGIKNLFPDGLESLKKVKCHSLVYKHFLI